MNLEELKERHPAVYRAARDEGAQRERSRAVAHLTMGESSGDLKTALASIRNGADLTFEIQAQYLAASMNRADTAERQAESDEAEATYENARPPPSGYRDDFGEAVLSRLTELVGVDEVGEAVPRVGTAAGKTK
jgi:hypothetical protein